MSHMGSVSTTGRWAPDSAPDYLDGRGMRRSARDWTFVGAVGCCERCGRSPSMPRLILLAALVLVLGVPSPARAAAPPGFVGIVSEDTLAGSPAYRDLQLRSMRARGVTLLRQTFDWSVIERRPGRYDFSFFDGFVGAAAKAGITVMPILFNPPSFHSRRPKRSKVRGTFPPKRPADMARYAVAAAQRYGPEGAFWRKHPSIPAMPVRTWQVWNEPNLPVYWRPTPSATGYVRLLEAVSRGLRTVDPGAEVVSAGLPDSASRGSVPLERYITTMLEAGAAEWITTLAINPYAARPQGVMEILESARRTLDAHGASQVQLRATELGWSDVGPGSPFRAGRQGQAARVGDLIAALGAQRESLKLLGFAYFNWRDAKPYPGYVDFWGLHTGLLTISGRPKPAMAAFAAATAAL